MAVNRARWWLARDSVQLVINAPAESIYDLIADLPRMGQWSPECKGAEWTGGTIGAAGGATFIGHNQGGPLQLFRWSRRGRVLTADRGRELAFVTDEGGRESTVWRYRFEPAEGGTLVTESYEVKWIPVWARIIDVPANRYRDLQNAMRRTLMQLKDAAEAATSSSRRPEPGRHSR